MNINFNTISSAINQVQAVINPVLPQAAPPPPQVKVEAEAPEEIRKVREMVADIMEQIDPIDNQSANRIRSALKRHVNTIVLIQNDYSLLDRSGVPLRQEVKDTIISKLKTAYFWSVQINDANIDKHMSDVDAVKIANDMRDSIEDFDFAPVSGELVNYFSSLLATDYSVATQFLNKVLKNYYSSLEFLDRKELMLHQLRETWEGSSEQTKISVLIRNSGPYFLKFLQTVVDKLKNRKEPKVVEFVEQMQSIKSSLPPTPQAYIDAILAEVNQKSPYPVEIVKSLGAATMGQTFLVRYKVNEVYTFAVMKMLRPNLAAKVEREETIFVREALGNPAMESLVEAFKLSMRDDLDFNKEASNTDQAGKFFDNKIIGTIGLVNELPRGENYFFMEFAPGRHLNHWLAKMENNPRLATLLRMNVELIVKKWMEILLAGLIHKDPHEGNIVIEVPFMEPRGEMKESEKSKYVRFIDWGSAGFLSPEECQHLYNIFLATSKTVYDPQDFICSIEAMRGEKYSAHEAELIVQICEKLLASSGTLSLGAIAEQMTREGLHMPELFAQMARATMHLQNLCESVNLKIKQCNVDLEPLSFASIAAEFLAHYSQNSLWGGGKNGVGFKPRHMVSIVKNWAFAPKIQSQQMSKNEIEAWQIILKNKNIAPQVASLSRKLQKVANSSIYIIKGRSYVENFCKEIEADKPNYISQLLDNKVQLQLLSDNACFISNQAKKKLVLELVKKIIAGPKSYQRRVQMVLLNKLLTYRKLEKSDLDELLKIFGVCGKFVELLTLAKESSCKKTFDVILEALHERINSGNLDEGDLEQMYAIIDAKIVDVDNALLLKIHCFEAIMKQMGIANGEDKNFYYSKLAEGNFAIPISILSVLQDPEARFFARLLREMGNGITIPSDDMPLLTVYMSGLSLLSEETQTMLGLIKTFSKGSEDKYAQMIFDACKKVTEIKINDKIYKK